MRDGRILVSAPSANGVWGYTPYDEDPLPKGLSVFALTSKVQDRTSIRWLSFKDLRDRVQSLGTVKFRKAYIKLSSAALVC